MDLMVGTAQKSKKKKKSTSVQQLNYFDSLFPPTTLYGHLICEGKQKQLGVTVLTLYAKTNVALYRKMKPIATLK